jgi:death-on-curing protein
MDYPTLEDFLIVAELVLDVPASRLLRVTKVNLAESALAAPQAEHFGVEHYPDPATKAAVLCSRVVANHALPDGNKRVGLVLMLEFIERNGMTWIPPEGGQQELADVIERLAGKDPRLGESDFVDWVRPRVAAGQGRQM